MDAKKGDEMNNTDDPRYLNPLDLLQRAQTLMGKGNATGYRYACLSIRFAIERMVLNDFDSGPIADAGLVLGDVSYLSGLADARRPISDAHREMLRSRLTRCIAKIDNT